MQLVHPNYSPLNTITNNSSITTISNSLSSTSNTNNFFNNNNNSNYKSISQCLTLILCIIMRLQLLQMRPIRTITISRVRIMRP